MTSLTLSILALSLLTGADARALSKKSVTWNACAELNKNISGLLEGVGPVNSFQCGSISVPLDYTNKSSPPLALDLFRVKAKKEPVLGTVLFNPGGPGGDAATNLPILASDLWSNIGEQYNLVSWDPRGTGYTIPYNCSLSAAATAPTKRDVERLDSINVTEYFLSQDGWDYAGLSAQACAAANNETGSFIGTAFTARDMLAIVDALGEDGMLRYYGISYGTVLGHYFAAMFPDRIDRMVLDANLDPKDYANGTWGDSIRHWDEVFNLFLDACYENKEECSFAKFIDANSTEDLFNAINQPLGQLATTLDANSSNVQALTAYTSIKGAIHNALYTPATWPTLADTIVAQLNATSSDAESDSDSAANSTATWTYGKAADAIQGIRSSDALWKVAKAEEYLPVAEYQANLSSFADLWYFRSWVSAQWPLPAKEQFEGKFEAKTKHPILYVNGDFDPVTPIEAAERASKGFEGSVVLGHDGIGHTVLADPSTCVQKHVQAYFSNGTLPEKGTHCDSDLKPWALAKARGGMPYGALNATESQS